MSKIVFALSADPSPEGDVRTGGVTKIEAVTTDGTVLFSQEFPGNTTDFGEVSIDKGLTGNFTLQDIDDDGNPGEILSAPFEAVDTFAPQSRQGFNVKAMREDS